MDGSRATLSTERTWQANSHCSQDARPLTLVAHLVSVSAQRAGPAPARAAGSPSPFQHGPTGEGVCRPVSTIGWVVRAPSLQADNDQKALVIFHSLCQSPFCLLISQDPGEQGGRRWVKGCMCKISSQNLPKSTFYRERKHILDTHWAFT